MNILYNIIILLKSPVLVTCLFSQFFLVHTYFQKVDYDIAKNKYSTIYIIIRKVKKFFSEIPKFYNSRGGYISYYIQIITLLKSPPPLVTCSFGLHCRKRTTVATSASPRTHVEKPTERFVCTVSVSFVLLLRVLPRAIPTRDVPRLLR